MNPETKRKKYGEKYALWLRNYQRQRARALTRLAQENPDRYQELLEEERLRDEAEGKTWLDLSGRTKRTVDSAGSPSRSVTSTQRQTNGNQQDEGDVGGEE
jgi:hypothetical protein